MTGTGAFRLKNLLICLALFSIAASTAHGQLERVGPINGAVGYPAWYQDRTGLALELCSPASAAELAGGWCLLLTGDTVAPEVFPGAFADEHFYWAANAEMTFAAGAVTAGRARLVLGLEGAFAGGPVVAGDQIVFARIRILVRDLPFSGTYKVYTPYTTWTFPDQVAGDRLFFTEDIGLACTPGDFSCALQGHIGPFLLASATPGGPELPAVPGPVPGKLYIADPARLGPVTGSPLPPFQTPQGIRNHNIFRVEGPNGFVIETTDFTLMGRLYSGTIPGRVTVDRASYTQSGSAPKVDVLATAAPTVQARTPGVPEPVTIMPVLRFYNAACNRTPANCCVTLPCPITVPPTPQCTLSAPVGETSFQMFNTDTRFWGQSHPASIPKNVCVEDATAPAVFERSVTDEVTITEALYSPENGGTLSVTADSSDKVDIGTLTLVGFGDLANGRVSVSPMAAPPSEVHVLSSHGGLAKVDVKTGLSAGNGAVPVATNDLATANEDTPTTINILANDTVNNNPIVFGPGVIVSILAAPQLGSAVVTATGSIQFTPAANANGSTSLSYTVAVNGVISSAAVVNITIVPVNDAPVSVSDTAQSALNVVTPIDVLANDTDPDGQADLTGAAIVTPPAAGATATVGADGVINFSASVAGTYIFTYRAVDSAGAFSTVPATVTVTVSGAETITVLLAEYRTNATRFRVNGTDSVRAGQTLAISYANGSRAGTTIATAVVAAGGTWAVDIRPATGVLDPRTSGATQIRITSPLGGSSLANIVVRQ